jgi:hypothetical protein
MGGQLIFAVVEQHRFAAGREVPGVAVGYAELDAYDVSADGKGAHFRSAFGNNYAGYFRPSQRRY